MAATSQSSNISLDKNQIKARILLALIVDDEQKKLDPKRDVLKKTGLRDRVLGKKKNKADFDQALESLEQAEVIEVTKKGTSFSISLKGESWQSVLGAEIGNLNFKDSGTVVGTWMATGLLKYIGLIKFAPNVATSATIPKISSYDQFKSLTLETYENLKQTNALYASGFVPIWHLRQQLGETITPENFNEWLMQTQTDRIFHLRTGGSEATEEQKNSSIHSEIRGLLFTLTKFE